MKKFEKCLFNNDIVYLADIIATWKCKSVNDLND